jgi:hypothetical protein
MLASQAFGIDSKGDDDGLVPSWGAPKRTSMFKKTFKAIGKVKKIKNVATKKQKKLPMELMTSDASFDFDLSEGNEEDEDDDDEDGDDLIGHTEEVEADLVEEGGNDEEQSDQDDVAEGEENGIMDYPENLKDEDNNDEGEGKACISDMGDRHRGGKSGKPRSKRGLVKGPSMAQDADDQAVTQFIPVSPVGRKGSLKEPRREGLASPRTPSSKKKTGVAKGLVGVPLDPIAVVAEDQAVSPPPAPKDNSAVVTPSPRRKFSLPVMGVGHRSPVVSDKTGATMDDSVAVEAKVGQNEQTLGRLSQTFGPGTAFDGYFSKIKELKQKLPPTAETWNAKKDKVPTEGKDGNETSVVLTLTDGEDPSLAATISIDLASDMKLKPMGSKSTEAMPEQTATTQGNDNNKASSNGDATGAESFLLSPKLFSKMFRRDKSGGKKDRKAKEERGFKSAATKEGGNKGDPASSTASTTEHDTSHSTPEEYQANSSPQNDASTDDHLADQIPDPRPSSARHISESSPGHVQKPRPASARQFSDSSSSISPKPISARQLSRGSSTNTLKRPSMTRHASAEESPSDRSRRLSSREKDDNSEELNSLGAPLTPGQPTSLRDIRRMMEAGKGGENEGFINALSEPPATPSTQPRALTRRTSRRLQRKQVTLDDLKSPKEEASTGHLSRDAVSRSISSGLGRHHNTDSSSAGARRARRSKSFTDTRMSQKNIPEESELETEVQENNPSSWVRNVERINEDSSQVAHRSRRSARNSEPPSRSQRSSDKGTSDNRGAEISISENGIPEEAETETSDLTKAASLKNLGDGSEDTPHTGHRNRRPSRPVEPASDKRRRGTRRGIQNNEASIESTQPKTTTPAPQRGFARSVSLRNFYGANEGKSRNLLLETFGSKEIGDDREHHSDGEVERATSKSAAKDDDAKTMIPEKDSTDQDSAANGTSKSDANDDDDGDDAITPFVTRRARPSYRRNGRVGLDNKSSGVGDSSRNLRSNRRTHTDEESKTSGVENRRMHSESELVSPRAGKHRAQSKDESTSPRANSNRRMHSDSTLDSSSGNSRRQSRPSRKKHAQRSPTTDSQTASELPQEGGEENVYKEEIMVVKDETKGDVELAEGPEEDDVSENGQNEKFEADFEADTSSGETPKGDTSFEAETQSGEAPKEEEIARVAELDVSSTLNMNPPKGKPPKGKSPRLSAALQMGSRKKGHEQMDDQSVFSDVFGSVNSDGSTHLFRPGMSFQIHTAEELCAPQLMFNLKENDEGMDVQVSNPHVPSN